MKRRTLPPYCLPSEGRSRHGFLQVVSVQSPVWLHQSPQAMSQQNKQFPSCNAMEKFSSVVRSEGRKGEKCFDCKLLHKLSRRRRAEGHASLQPNLRLSSGPSVSERLFLCRLDSSLPSDGEVKFVKGVNEIFQNSRHFRGVLSPVGPHETHAHFRTAVMSRSPFLPPRSPHFW